MRTPLAASLLLALVATAVPATPAAAVPAPGSSTPGERDYPRLQVTTRVADLDHPWDVKRLPGEGLLISERDAARLTLVDGGQRRVLDFPSERVWVAGETGLMGLEVDPDFAENRRFYTCQGGSPGGERHDVRVVAWTLSEDATAVTQAGVLVRGIQATSGRHGGCRLLIASGGALLVGTGDAAVGTNPRDRRSLNGKVLRLNRMTGRPHRGNPWSEARSRDRRYLYTYGHRNVQGLAERRDGTWWSVEHGPDRDDEVNLLRRGGDYGWHPVPAGGGPGYNERVPMTDRSLPGRQRGAAWRSGYPTIAPAGAAFLRGKRWGGYAGTLAVSVLKDQEMVFLRFDRAGRLRGERTPRALTRHGRLRSVTQLPNGALLVTTDGRADGDRVLRVVPRP